ncbi:MAG: 23S rRNA (guanosine(2251)-2'-O)-methyltransferase RlmB [Desulfobulbaceae bacterium]|nr:23S rRNA (guanosine(2251)-2'-O)-methyltransferase RlmB [Desulfobulbaceae bacterium]
MKKPKAKLNHSRPAGKADEAPVSGDLLWGINTVREALEKSPRNVHEVLVQRGKSGQKHQEIIDLARSQNIRLRFVEPNRLGVPPHCRHQGVTARQAAAELLTLEELLEKGETRLLVLDSIQDPHNLGAVFRSALAAGFRSLILTRERSAPLSGTVAKTSAGAVSQLKICQVVNLSESLKILKKKGFWIYGAVARSGEAASVYETDFMEPFCLIVGSEGKGIRPLVLRQCDHLVTIPIQGNFDSLNVSVAAAVIMFEIVRQKNLQE